MEAHDAVADVGRDLRTGSPPVARWHGRWLVLARMAWLLVAGLSIGLILLDLPLYASQLRTVCSAQIAAACPDGTLTSAGAQALHGMGVSVESYVWYTVAMHALSVLVWASIGLVIFWRRSDEWMGWLTALLLVIYNVALEGRPTSALIHYSPLWSGPLAFLSFLAEALFGLFVFLFPNGRLVPRWTGWVLALYVAELGARHFVPSDAVLNENNWPNWLVIFFGLILSGSIVYSQIYRYRRVLTPTERQQTKWVLLGIVFLLGGGFTLSTVVEWLLLTPELYNVVNFSLWILLSLVIPVSLGIAMLRYRLWDIDLIIRRTLIYGSLTFILAGVYVAGVIGAQALINTLGRQPGAAASPPLIVVTTLVIAALFQPLRRRLQATIDRRFYRRKYDAERTLVAFAATLREEVETPELTKRLLGVVEETMQPAQISLWLRRDESLPQMRHDTRHA